MVDPTLSSKQKFGQLETKYLFQIYIFIQKKKLYRVESNGGKGRGRVNEQRYM